MNQQENNSDTSFSYNTYACAPPSANESVFFNLILNTKYENTKDNCLIFLKNYSKNMAINKRDLFKNMINELTLVPISNKIMSNDNDESLYLIRACIKKYSRQNIINSLYEFISQNEININSNSNSNNISNINSTSDNSNVNSLFDKIEKVENNEEIQDENDKGKIVNKDIEDIDIINDINKKEKNINLLKRKRKHHSEENIHNAKKFKNSSSNEDKKDEEVNNENINNINNINIKKEKIDDENDSDNVKIKQEKDDFFERSFGFAEEKEFKNKLRLRNKSFSNRIIPKKNAQRSNSIQDDKINPHPKGKRGRKKLSNINKEKIIEEKNIRSHMIKINRTVVSYNMDKSKAIDDNKIVFLCNNNECKGKGVYLMDKKVFEETEKHDFKKCTHVIAHKNKNIKDKLLRDKNCDGYQILRDDKFIRDKNVLYLK